MRAISVNYLSSAIFAVSLNIVGCATNGAGVDKDGSSGDEGDSNEQTDSGSDGVDATKSTDSGDATGDDSCDSAGNCDSGEDGSDGSDGSDGDETTTGSTSSDDDDDQSGGDRKIIDDFEDGDEKLQRHAQHERRGYWYYRTQAEDGGWTEQPFEVSDGGPGSSRHCARFAGNDVEPGTSQLGAHFLAEAGSTPKTVKVAHRGIKFRARGEGAFRLRYATRAVVSSENGGACKAPTQLCGDARALSFSVEDDWKSYTLYFDDPDVLPDAWGASGKFELDHSLGMWFENVDTNFELEVDELVFVDDKPEFCEHQYSYLRSPLANRPFPADESTASIRPNHRCQADLDHDVAAFYEVWKSRYLRENSDGVYVEMEGTCDNPTFTTSEAHGYGMMIVALMAGYEPEAKELLQGMLAFAKAHPSPNTPGLMNGCIGEADAPGSSATDGDLDIAYGLLLADKQFGGLESAAKDWIAAQETERVIRSNGRPSLGDWDSSSDRTRPSDWIFDHFRVFASYRNADRWNNARNTTLRMASELIDGYAPATGLLPDFVIGDPAQPAWADFLEGPHDGDYYYNACRVPWRLGLEYGFNPEPQTKALLDSFVPWAVSASYGNPALFRGGYLLDGTPINDWSDRTFVAPLVVASAYDSANQEFVNLGWDILADHTGYFLDENYFTDSIRLMSMLYLSGNWWEPL